MGAIGKTITGGVEVFDNACLDGWPQTTAERREWLTHLDAMEKLLPTTVIPGHYLGEARFDTRAIGFTRDYVKAFEVAAKPSKDSAELIQRCWRYTHKCQPMQGLRSAPKFTWAKWSGLCKSSHTYLGDEVQLVSYSANS